MKTSKSVILGMVLLAALAAVAQTSSNVSVFATGLNNPRGLKFGPDGNLYVAEGGAGGTMSSVGSCTQVVAPVGPYTGGFTARISKITPDGTRSTVADNLPSNQTSSAPKAVWSVVLPMLPSLETHCTQFAVSGLAAPHGLVGTDNAVLRVNADGSTTMIADLSVFQKGHRVKNPEPDDFEPDGTWYSIIPVNGVLYAIEPNHGELDSITTSGHIQRVIDISNIQGHIIPTAIAYDGQNFLVGNLDRFPITGDSSKIIKITPTGAVTTVNIDFNTVVGLAFDNKGRLYVLENTTGNPFPHSEHGKSLANR